MPMRAPWCACTCVCVCVCAYVSLTHVRSVPSCMRLYSHVYMCVCMCVSVHGDMCVSPCMCVRAYLQQLNLVPQCGSKAPWFHEIPLKINHN